MKPLQYLPSLWRWLSLSKPAGSLRQAEGALGLSSYILTTIAAQAAIAVENGRLLETVAQQERLWREFELARQIQQNPGHLFLFTGWRSTLAQVQPIHPHLAARPGDFTLHRWSG